MFRSLHIRNPLTNNHHLEKSIVFRHNANITIRSFQLFYLVFPYKKYVVRMPQMGKLDLKLRYLSLQEGASYLLVKKCPIIVVGKCCVLLVNGQVTMKSNLVGDYCLHQEQCDGSSNWNQIQHKGLKESKLQAWFHGKETYLS